MACKLNIVFDLDETLINSVPEKMWGAITQEAASKLRNFKMNLGSEKFWVFVRPYVHDDFFSWIFQTFNVGVITAATHRYATEIVYELMLKGHPERTLSFLRTRETYQHMYNVEHKRLAYLFQAIRPYNFHPCNTILLDDNQDVKLTNLYNVIRIKAWFVLKTWQEKNVTKVMFDVGCLNDDQIVTVRGILQYWYTKMASENPCTIHSDYTICKNLQTPIFQSYHLLDPRYVKYNQEEDDITQLHRYYIDDMKSSEEAPAESEVLLSDSSRFSISAEDGPN